MNQQIKPLLTGLLLCSLANPARAGLSAVQTTTVFQGRTADELPDFSLSLYPGKASFLSRGAQDVSETFGRGTAADYILFNHRTTSDPMKLLPYAQGEAGLMGETQVKFFSRRASEYLNAWIKTDPGSSFSARPDFKGDSEAREYTSVCAQDITGTVDISKLSEGSVFLIYGSFKDSVTVTASLSGPGRPEQTAKHTEPHGAPRIHWWITEFKFSDAQQYDTLTYHYANADEDGSRAHFIGVILDAELPLDTIGLLN